MLKCLCVYVRWGRLVKAIFSFSEAAMQARKKLQQLLWFQQGGGKRKKKKNQARDPNTMLAF